MASTYSEEEVRELLHAALQLQEDAIARERRSDGLTLEEISAIAEEVGIDPAFVAMAAEKRAEENAVERKKGLLGQTRQLVLRGVMEGVLDEKKAEAMVSRFRKVMGTRGTLSMAGGHLEWTAEKRSGERLRVNIVPRDGSSDVTLIHKPQKPPLTDWLPALMPMLFPLIILLSGGPLFALVVFTLFATFMSTMALSATRKKVASNDARDHRKVEGLLSGVETILGDSTKKTLGRGASEASGERLDESLPAMAEQRDLGVQSEQDVSATRHRTRTR